MYSNKNKKVLDSLYIVKNALSGAIIMVENDEEPLEIILKLEQIMAKLKDTHLHYIRLNLKHLTKSLYKDSIKGKLLEKDLINLWQDID